LLVTARFTPRGYAAALARPAPDDRVAQVN
jgi:hypothetical protein